jgi:hypothetical protein
MSIPNTNLHPDLNQIGQESSSYGAVLQNTSALMDQELSRIPFVNWAVDIELRSEVSSLSDPATCTHSFRISSMLAEEYQDIQTENIRPGHVSYERVVSFINRKFNIRLDLQKHELGFTANAPSPDVLPAYYTISNELTLRNALSVIFNTTRIQYGTPKLKLCLWSSPPTSSSLPRGRRATLNRREARKISPPSMPGRTIRSTTPPVEPHIIPEVPYPIPLPTGLLPTQSPSSTPSLTEKNLSLSAVAPVDNDPVSTQLVEIPQDHRPDIAQPVGNSSEHAPDIAQPVGNSSEHAPGIVPPVENHPDHATGTSTPVAVTFIEAPDKSPRRRAQSVFSDYGSDTEGSRKARSDNGEETASADKPFEDEAYDDDMSAAIKRGSRFDKINFTSGHSERADPAKHPVRGDFDTDEEFRDYEAWYLQDLRDQDQES